jgi:hypothetical protein
MLKKIYFVKDDECRADNDSEDHGSDCQVIPESVVIISSHILFISGVHSSCPFTYIFVLGYS